MLVSGERWFVKASNEPDIVESFQRAIQLHATVRHPALPRLHNTFGTPGGLALVYDWVPGEVLNDPRVTREQRYSDSMHPHVRFHSLPVPEILSPLETIFDVHALVAENGFVASDFHDGCITCDFEGARTFLCDFDEYRDGSLVLKKDRAYGSARFMAPEEFQRGATIDEVTNMFKLRRTAVVLLGDRTASLDPWKDTDGMKAVVVRATDPDRGQRHQSVGEFVHEWRAAVSGS